MMTTQKTIPVNRSLVGLLAGCCLAAAAGILVWGDPTSQNAQLWRGAFTRVGLLMSTFWVALPTRENDPAWVGVSLWTFVGVVAAIVGIALRPKVAIPFIVIVSVVGYVLRPRRPKRPPETYKLRQKASRS